MEEVEHSLPSLVSEEQLAVIPSLLHYPRGQPTAAHAFPHETLAA